jgi:hypothetical protein
MITADQKRMNIMYKLIDNGWHAVDFNSPETIEWCRRNLGHEYISWEADRTVTTAKWLTARIRVETYGWQWFCAFKNAEDLMWYRMNFNCTVVDKSTHVV